MFQGNPRNDKMIRTDSAGKGTALITGASSGIGYELALLFARKGHSLVLVARNQETLRKLAEKLEQEYGIRAVVISKDLSLSSTPEEVFRELSEKSIPVHTLVNNAGFGTRGMFAGADVDSQLKMIQVNMTALTHLTRLFLNRMLSSRNGRILNVASTAAFQPGPLMAVYYATKAYVLSFSEALASELRGSGVTVTALCPGPTRTEFERRAGMEGSRLFRSGVMNSKTVAEAGYRGLMKGKAVVISGLRNRLLAMTIKLVPRKWVKGAVRRMNDNPS